MNSSLSISADPRIRRPARVRIGPECRKVTPVGHPSRRSSCSSGDGDQAPPLEQGLDARRPADDRRVGLHRLDRVAPREQLGRRTARRGRAAGRRSPGTTRRCRRRAPRSRCTRSSRRCSRRRRRARSRCCGSAGARGAARGRVGPARPPRTPPRPGARCLAGASRCHSRSSSAAPRYSVVREPLSVAAGGASRPGTSSGSGSPRPVVPA